MSDPRPQEELRLLGFAGASELEHSRQRMRNLVFNMHAQRAGAGERSTSHAEGLPEDFTGLTPKLEKQLREAGPHVPLAGRVLRGALETPDLAHLAATGHTEHPWVAGLEAATLFPFGRPLRALRAASAAGGALRLGLGRTGARAASRAVFEGPSVAGALGRSAIGKIKLRDFRVGDEVVQIPAARSRTGRVVENMADRFRRRAGGRVPGVKRTEAKAFEELNRTQRYRNRVPEARIRRLEQIGKKLNDPQEYALRLDLEQSTPQEAFAHHMELAKSSEFDQQKLYHSMHADMARRAEKYLRVAEDGSVHLREDIPRYMKEARDLMVKIAGGREDAYREMSLISDEQIVNRLSAPARVRRGARFKGAEEILRTTLESSPRREEARQQAEELAARMTTDPDRQRIAVNGMMQLFDANVRVAARQTYGDQQLFGQVLDYLRGVHGGMTEAPPGALTQMPEDQRAMYDAATVDLAFGNQTPEEVAAKYQLDPELLVQHAAEHGEQLTGRILSNKEWWPGGADEGTLFQQGDAQDRADWDALQTGLPGFTSHARNVIEGMPQDKMTPDQLLAYLDKQGVKKDELEWASFRVFIRGAKERGQKTVSKEEALAWFDDQSIQLEEVRISEADPAGTQYADYVLPGDHTNYEEYLLTLPWDKYGHLYHSPHWEGEQNPIVHIRTTDRKVDGEDALFIEEIQSDWHQAGRKRGYLDPEEKARLIQVKDDAYNVYHGSAARLSEFQRQHNIEALGTEDPEVGREYKRLVDENHAAWTEWERASRAASNTMEQPAAGPFSKTWHELAFKRMLRVARDKGYKRIAWTTGKQQANRYSLADHVDKLVWHPPLPGEEYGTLRGYRGEGQVISRSIKESELPEYVGTEAASKIEERLASKVNFNPDDFIPIAYGPWKEPVPLYKLQRDTVARLQGRGKMVQVLKDGHAGEKVPVRLLDTGEMRQLPSRTLGQWMVPKTPELGGKYARLFDKTAELKGDDLQVGGHGMAAFYDKMLPSFVNKYLKKYGGRVETGKVSEVKTAKWEAAYHTPATLPEHLDNPDYVGGWIVHEVDNPASVPFIHDSEQTAQDHADLLNGVHGNLQDEKKLAGSKVHSVEITPQIGEFIDSGQRLFQRGGSLDRVSPFGVKGAITFSGPAHAVESVIRFSEHADISTFVHEVFGHWSPQWLPDNDYRSLARWAGGNFDPARGEIDRDAAEKVAQGMEQYIREGVGPTPVKQAVTSLSPYFRELYDGAELPELSPRVRQVFERMFAHGRVEGGQLVGPEDFGPLGFARVPTLHGRPIPRGLTSVHRRLNSYAKYILSGGKTIGKGPEDIALRKQYEGAALMSGYFTFDAVKPTARDALLAVRLATVHRVRESLVRAGRDLPTDYTDIAVKVNPDKTTPKAVGLVLDKMREIDRAGGKLSRADMDKIQFDLLEESGRDIFPARLDGPEGERDIREVAQEILNTNEPIENIKWIPREWIESSGLIPPTGHLAHIAAGLRGSKGMIAVDAINDLQKIAVLYLNPAYVPINLIGNLVMNTMQQGVFTPVNLYRSALMHQWLDGWERKMIDNQMGNGLTASLGLRSGPGTFIHGTLGHWINQAVDLIPRRAAFLHEARRAGYKSKESVRDLIRKADSGDQESIDAMVAISRTANDAIVDYERMSPLERELTSRLIFFYPWLKGASRYSYRFALEHPVQFTALALAAEHAYTVQQQELGTTPFYEATDVPISTRSLGVGPYSLADVFGTHEWVRGGLPMVADARQGLTFTTPLDIYRSGIALVTGDPNAPSLVDNVTPFLSAAMVSLQGYDPFTHKEVPRSLGTFLKQMEQIPQKDRWSELAPADWGGMTDEERRLKFENSINPRTREEAFWRLIGSGLAPTRYNREVAAKRLLSDAPTKVRHRVELEAGAKKYGLGQVDEKVLAQLEEYDSMEHDIRSGMKAHEKLGVVVGYLKRHPELKHAGDIDSIVQRVATTEERADALYQAIRHDLEYHAWRDYWKMKTMIDHKDKKAEGAQPVG